MRFQPSFLDEIRRRVTISSVVADRVVWDKRKTNPSRGDWWACCPFHGEKSPSFHCEDKKGRYHCFSCGASGDHFSFLTNLDGISFPQAVEKLAARAGIAMPVFNLQVNNEDKRIKSLYSVLELAACFFERQLQGTQGAQAREYLRARNLSLDTQRLFRLGYAPDQRSLLKEFLLSEGVAQASIDACGLTVFEDVAVPFDRFRHRVMFPIEDSRGRIIAFGGRALSQKASAKYMNSPETEIFHKKKILYNFSRARKLSQKNATILVVEGYMDVIALTQAGFQNVVAPLGTSMTPDHIQSLWRLCSEPILCFDGDYAGVQAASRVLDLILPIIDSTYSLRFCLLPEGQDPDDIICKEGSQKFRSLIKESLSFCDMLWKRETKGVAFDTPELRARLENRFQDVLSSIKDRGLRFHYIYEMRHRMRHLFGFSSKAPVSKQHSSFPANSFSSARQKWVKDEPATLLVSESLKSSPLVKNTALTSMPLREAVIIVTLVHHNFLVEEFFEDIEGMLFSHPDLAQLFKVIIDSLVSRTVHDTEELLDSIARVNLTKIWEQASLKVKNAQHWPSFKDATLEDVRHAFLQLINLYHLGKNSKNQLYILGELFANDPTEENYLSLIDVHSQFQDMQGQDALIEGFGSTSAKKEKN